METKRRCEGLGVKGVTGHPRPCPTGAVTPVERTQVGRTGQGPRIHRPARAGALNQRGPGRGVGENRPAHPLRFRISNCWPRPFT